MNLDDLTVFFITTGEETATDALRALEQQDCTFRLEFIRDVYPMSAAFQAMPDRCRTRYFVQVDADMVLEPHAIRTLYEAIRNTGLRTYMVYAPLYEEGFGVGGAVKCWKRGLFRFFSFRDVRTVDRDLHRRAQRWGLRTRGLGRVLGRHRPRHSPFSLYLKAKSDVEKWRFLGRPPEMYAQSLLDRVLQARPLDAHRLLGLLCGALTGWDRLCRSKDIRRERDRYRRLLDILEQEPGLSRIHERGLSDPDSLRRDFAACYRDREARNGPVRRRLAERIVALFGPARPDHTLSERLLRILEA